MYFKDEKFFLNADREREIRICELWRFTYRYQEIEIIFLHYFDADAEQT